MPVSKKTAKKRSKYAKKVSKKKISQSVSYSKKKKINIVVNVNSHNKGKTN